MASRRVFWVYLIFPLLWACGRGSGYGPQPAQVPVEQPAVWWGVDDNQDAHAGRRRARGPGRPFLSRRLSWGQRQTDQFEITVAQLWEQCRLKTFIAETAFPAADTWSGWNKPIAGYPMDEAGQALFLRDLRQRTFLDERIAGAVWWSPEGIHPHADWSVNSLFRTADLRLKYPGSRPALFGLAANQQVAGGRAFFHRSVLALDRLILPQAA